MKLSRAQARALDAASRGELRRWKEAAGFAAGGKTYAVGLGTVQKATIDSLTASQPPLLADGEPTERDVPLVLTASGRAALAEHRQPYLRHVGKARTR
ncbi:MAG: hypothetical protein ABW022_15720 [Actinoplanes sp.]